ncbi:hypothetical protein [Pseudomonas gingeri]|uniref:Uncharacterized protein n=1 Tax=Pseudomonas gingeri TaxID=117681 RepID=A0A7Y8CL17_9PSED|nr:hypothetical protein [Pseudomonas gingeri]NWB29036.1 hypothetical protein [Pseudomonas gingeri]NWC34130.1 hypothetical protein [Pseudomonas gingeri]NWD48161.1 hypothetical protein [Pseudomonas gingeri]
MNELLDFSLKTEAGNLVFSLIRADECAGVFDFELSCVFVGSFSRYLPGKFSCRLYRGDIERLIAYFFNHVQSLVLGGEESPVYVPLESDFQIKCLSGDVVDFSDGYFSMSVMFNCGVGGEGSANTYFGFETIVDVGELSLFCEELRRISVI